MNLKQEFSMAVKELSCNKLRSFLTVLGVVIGVSSIILLMSVSESMIKGINIQFDTLRSNGITVFVHPKNYKKRIKYYDVDKFFDLQNVKGMYAITEGVVRVQYKNKNDMIKVVGTSDNYLKLKRLDILKGRFIIKSDIESRNRVVVLGEKVARDMFDNKNPINQDIKIRGIPYRVIGVLCREGGNIMGSCDEVIIFPISNTEVILRNSGIKSMYIEAENNLNVDKVSSNIGRKMRKFFDNEEDYKIINQHNIFKVVNKIQNILKASISIIAGISLIVAGIGIMNIMLVAVNERTKEIGIRKALGAKKKDILYQFLMESCVISLIGGVSGCIIGIIGSFIINKILEVTYKISWGSIFISLTFSLVIGIVFGIMPANKAAKLKPVDAFRCE